MGNSTVKHQLLRALLSSICTLCHSMDLDAAEGLLKQDTHWVEAQALLSAGRSQR